MNDVFTQKVVEILGQLQSAVGNVAALAGKAAPQVVEYALKVKVYEGISSLVEGLLALLFAIIVLTTMYRKRKAVIEAFDYANDNPPVIIATIVFAVLSGIALITGVITVCDTWNWVAVFDPKIALAHDIVQRVMGQQ